MTIWPTIYRACLACAIGLAMNFQGASAQVVEQPASPSSTPNAAAPAPAATTQRTAYVVELLELALTQVDEETAKELNQAESIYPLLQRLASSDRAAHFERLTASAVPAQKSTIQYGKRVAQRVSTSAFEGRGGARPASSAFQYVNVGTMATFVLQPTDTPDEFVLQLQYEVSREGMDDGTTPPDTTTQSVSVNVPIHLGRTKIIHSSTGDQLVLLAATVRPQHEFTAWTPIARRQAAETAVFAVPSPFSAAPREPVALPSLSQPRAEAAPDTAIDGDDETVQFRSVNGLGFQGSDNVRERFANMVLDKADTNGDGQVSLTEAQQVPSLFRRFHEMDTNQDEALSSTEIVDGILRPRATPGSNNEASSE
jgi:hypothetical protein